MVPAPAFPTDHTAVLVQANVPVLEGSDWTDVVLTNDNADRRYVNMYNLPDWGTLGLNLLLPAGIAVSEQAQMQAGIVPSFVNGYGLAIGSDISGAGALAL